MMMLLSLAERIVQTDLIRGSRSHHRCIWPSGGCMQGVWPEFNFGGGAAVRTNIEGVGDYWG